MPELGAAPAAWIVPGILAALGITGLASGIRATEPTPTPFGSDGPWWQRLAWAMRPRLWMIAWMILIGAMSWYGSPHLRIVYTLSSVVSECTYLGLNGWETRTYRGPQCPPVEWIPLR